MSFIFGGDTGVSHEDVKRKREMANALLAGNMLRSPRNAGEGLTAIGNALMYRNLSKKASEGQAKLDAEAADIMSGLFGGGGPRVSTSGSYTPSEPVEVNPGPDAADPRRGAFATGGSGATLSMEDQIRQGLKARGMPEHVAEAFIMNFRDESGLRTDINEIEPLVPGSRGGFGLAQWTGPRRKQLEAFAAERGAPVSDLNTQLDFLMQELQGSESNAANAILSTQNRGDAAAAIVNQFLRPAEVNRARREASYLGGGNTAGGGSPSVEALMRAASNPTVMSNPGNAMVVQSLLNQALTPPDPMADLNRRKAELQIEALENPKPQAAPADIQKYEYYAAQETNAGRTPLSYGEWSVMDERAGVGPTPPELVGTEGQALALNPQTGQWEMSILPNSKLAQERADLEERGDKADEIKETATNLVLDEIGIARELIEGQSLTSPATGITGSLASNIDSTRAGALKNRLTTIKANIGFDKLQSMRDASPTGGALGQVSEFENRLLQAVFGSLEQAQRGEDILYNLQRLEDIYNRVVHTGIPDDEARQLYQEVTMSGFESGSAGGSNPYAALTEQQFSEIDIDSLTPEQLKQLAAARGVK